jgi:hypothetical protein
MPYRFAGVTLDWYDDRGETLKQKFPTADKLPSFIKEAQVRPQEKVANEEFALVAIDGGNLLRKYACHDPGTTAMSVIYFMEHGHKLPEEAQKTAASNLVGACLRHQLLPPVPLTKMAGPLSWLKERSARPWEWVGEQIGRGAGKTLPTKEIAQQAGREAVRAGSKEMADAIAKTVRRVGTAGGIGAVGGGISAAGRDGDPIAGAMRGAGAGMLGGTLGGAFGRGVNPKYMLPAGAASALLAGLGAGSTASQEGKPLAQLSMPGLDVSVGTPMYRGEAPLEPQTPNIEVLGGDKVASVVDITGKQPKTLIKEAAPMNDNDYAVIMPDGRKLYPINTWDRVKTAEVYFQDNGIRMAPEIRRQFAVKLAAKANTIGYPLDETIKEAGATQRAPDGHMKQALEMRKVACAPGDDRKFLDELFEKRAEMPPQVYAEVLRRFDVAHGLDKGWDQVVLDPWSSTYSMTKIAEVVWEEGAERVTDLELTNLALEHGGALYDVYGMHFADEFSKDPIGIFKSMPTPQKKHIARLAQNMAARGSTESSEPLKKNASSVFSI